MSIVALMQSPQSAPAVVCQYMATRLRGGDSTCNSPVDRCSAVATEDGRSSPNSRLEADGLVNFHRHGDNWCSSGYMVRLLGRKMVWTNGGGGANF
jgi:hypothetical protein